MTGFDAGRLSCAGRNYEALQNMPLNVGRRNRTSIVFKYREVAAFRRICSENDPRYRRVPWSDVR